MQISASKNCNTIQKPHMYVFNSENGGAFIINPLIAVHGYNVAIITILLYVYYYIYASQSHNHTNNYYRKL